MTPKNIAPRAAELDQRFQSVKNDREDFDEGLSEVHAMDRPAYLAFLARRGATPYGRLFSELRDLVLPGVLDAYSRGDDQERQAILEVLEEHPFVTLKIWSLLDEQAWLFAKTPAAEKPAALPRLLLLAVLIPEYLDEVDTARILGGIWRDAEANGLDPRRFFDEAANLASPVKLEHGRSAQELLRDFESNFY